MSVAINCDICGKAIHDVCYSISAYGVQGLVSNNPTPMYTHDFHSSCITKWVREAFTNEESTEDSGEG